SMFPHWQPSLPINNRAERTEAPQAKKTPIRTRETEGKKRTEWTVCTVTKKRNLRKKHKQIQARTPRLYVLHGHLRGRRALLEKTARMPLKRENPLYVLHCTVAQTTVQTTAQNRKRQASHLRTTNHDGIGTHH